MADDTQAPAVPDPALSAPVAAAVASPGAVAPAPAAAAPAADPAAGAVPPPSGEPPEWAIARIDRLTRDKKEKDERLLAKGIDPNTLEPIPGRFVAPQAPAAAPAPGFAPLPPPTFDPVAEDQRIQAAARQMRFTDRCNEIAQAGAIAHPDFQIVINQLGMAGALSEDLIQAAMEIGDTSELLYALAKDLNAAHKIAALSPTQKAVALVKFDQDRRATAGKKISGAPAPLPVSVGGAAAAPLAGVPTPEMDDETWFRLREKQTGKFSGQFDS